VRRKHPLVSFGDKFRSPQRVEWDDEIAMSYDSVVEGKMKTARETSSRRGGKNGGEGMESGGGKGLDT